MPRAAACRHTCRCRASPPSRSSRVVDAIRLPTYARPRTGKALTEGDAILYADAVRAQFGLDGTGVRVGVVSDGMKGVFATGCTTSAAASTAGRSRPAICRLRPALRNAAGVLDGIHRRHRRPIVSAPTAISKGCRRRRPRARSPGAGAEGTALLEIVHDLAPGAKLSFANGDTDLAFNQAVNFLAASNDVVARRHRLLTASRTTAPAACRPNTAAALNNPALADPRLRHRGRQRCRRALLSAAYVDSGVDGTSIAGITTPGICICSSGPPTPPTCSGSARSRTT